MRTALAEAGQAREAGEVPVGAVIVLNGERLAAAHNHPIALHDPSAHAGASAIRWAAVAVGNYRLPGATLYVTLEPCLMCAGAILHARIDRLVFGAADQRTAPWSASIACSMTGGSTTPSPSRRGPPGCMRRNFEWIFSRKEVSITSVM